MDFPTEINNQKDFLESLYHQYNKSVFINPDPLECVYDYSKKADQEIVGFISASFAYGNVQTILKSVRFILKNLGSSPSVFLKEAPLAEIKKVTRNFYHRWHRESDLEGLLLGIKKNLHLYGSLQNCFLKNYNDYQPTIFQALGCFVDELSFYPMKKNLLTHPNRGSACKRMLMFLRWMVRCDDVDLGLWKKVKPSKLVVPLDTHMFAMSQKLNFTKRKQANWKTALEVTEQFKKINPDDPVKYDFCLTRFGIRRI